MTVPAQRLLVGRARGLKQQVTRLRYAAADHEAARVEDRGQISQPLPQPAPHRLEAPQRNRIALLRRSGDLGT